jgi:hypothetical protein
MALDARIYVRGARPFGSEIVTALAPLLSSWANAGEQIFTGLSKGVPWVEGYERFYSPDYPRGDWSKIRAAITYLQQRYPGAEFTVLYGSDSDWSADEARPVTEEMLAELDKAWTDQQEETPWSR